jgi:hypothetical protein
MDSEKYPAIFTTITSSQMWGVSDNSKVDIFCCNIMRDVDVYLNKQPPIRDIELGNLQITVCEIGKVIHELKEGNYPFVLGVVSPMVISGSHIHRKILKILDAYRTIPIKCIIRMAHYNIEKYHKEISTNQNIEKLNRINRNIIFGMRYLDNVSFEDICFGIPRITTFGALINNLEALKAHLDETKFSVNDITEYKSDLDDVLIEARMCREDCHE